MPAMDPNLKPWHGSSGPYINLRRRYPSHHHHQRRTPARPAGRHRQWILQGIPQNRRVQGTLSKIAGSQRFSGVAGFIIIISNKTLARAVRSAREPGALQRAPCAMAFSGPPSPPPRRRPGPRRAGHWRVSPAARLRPRGPAASSPAVPPFRRGAPAGAVPSSSKHSLVSPCLVFLFRLFLGMASRPRATRAGCYWAGPS